MSLHAEHPRERGTPLREVSFYAELHHFLAVVGFARALRG
jgi:hypothetical protein